MFENIRHVHPTGGRKHMTDNEPCWCNPAIFKICTQCNGSKEPCWVCGGEGMIETDSPQSGDKIIIVHQET